MTTINKHQNNSYIQTMEHLVSQLSIKGSSTIHEKVLPVRTRLPQSCSKLQEAPALRPAQASLYSRDASGRSMEKPRC